jgi:glycosyltransferase involved in cell wall biosynthesis
MSDNEKATNQFPKVSIVIPTRERSRTLVHTLKTCTSQTYPNLEIIVSDNFSQDDTKEVVQSLRDSRIKYINTGERISMSHNWEFALSYVTGDFVTYVGDDDGFLPEAISELVKILRKAEAKAISWRWASYFWPDCINEASRSLLMVPVSGHLEERDTRTVLGKVLNFECGYNELPFLYKGIICRRVVDNIRELSGGSFFHSINPDMYSAIAISAVVDKYIYSTIPFSLNGTSSYSNGASQFNREKSSTEANKFDSENNIPFHPDLEIAPSHPICVAECFLQARKHLPALGHYPFDLNKMICAAYSEVRNETEWRFKIVKEAVIKIAEKNGLPGVAEKTFINPSRSQNNKNLPPIGLTPGLNIYHKHLIVDCTPIGVTEIHAASILCALILNRRSVHLGWSISSLIKTNFAILLGVLRRYLRRFWKNGI